MPIVYEPAQPVAAAVSLGAGGGGAGVRQQTNPLLVAQQGNMLGLYGQGAALAARAVEGAADRAQAASQFRLAQELQARERGYDRDLEGSMSQARNEAQLAQQRQSADLQNWLMNQEMSQKEIIRLQQQKAAIGEVTANPDLSPAEKQEFIMKLRTGIDVGEARLKTQQAKSMQTQEELVRTQTMKAAELDLQTRKLNAKTAQQRVEVVQDPIVKRQVEEEFDATFPEWRQQMATAAASQDAAAVQALVAQRKKAINAEVEERDGTHSFYEEAPGKKIPLKKGVLDGPDGAGGGKAGGGKGAAKTLMSPEQFNKLRDDITEEVNADKTVPEDQKGIERDRRLKDKVDTYHAYADSQNPKPEARKPFAGVKRPGGVSESTGTPPAGGGGRPAEPPKPFSLAEPGTMNVNQRKAIDTLDQFAASLGGRADIPQERQVAAALAVNRAKELIAKHGRVPTEGPDKAEYDRLESILNLIPPEPKPAPGAPAAPPAAAAPAPRLPAVSGLGTVG